MYEILYLLLMIGLNILVNYLYKRNLVFPLLFMLFEIIYAISIISINEIYILFLLVFGIVYNVLILKEN